MVGARTVEAVVVADGRYPVAFLVQAVRVSA